MRLKSRRLRWAGHVARIKQYKSTHKILGGKPDGKRPLGRPKCRWEDNIKLDVREVGCDERDWIEVVQDRVQLRKDGNELQGSIKAN